MNRKSGGELFPKSRWLQVEASSRFSLLFTHDPFGKPVRTPHQVRDRHFPDHALLAEGESELSDDFGRHRGLVLAIAFRQPVLRHPERAEQDIPDRKTAGEIGVAAL